MAIVDPKDSVFANAADAVSDFETMFDEEDSLIEMVEGFGENGESLIGRDPEEEYTTDNSDGKVDMEDSSPSTDFNLNPDAETGKGVNESVDLDDLFGVDESDDGSAEDIEKDAETGKEVNNSLSDGQASGVQTDETDKKDILEEPVETDEKEFHNEGSDLGVQDDLGVQGKLGVQDDLGAQGDECNELTHGSLCPKCGCDPCKCGGNSGKAEEQTDETNKKDILEEIDDKEEKDFHNESVEDLLNLWESEEQTDETNKKDILEEPVETDKKDFHDGEVQIDNVKESEEQTDETNKKDILEEIDDKEEKDFHNEGAELDALFESLGLDDINESDEQTDETNKNDILEEPVETDEKEFHNEGAELDALFESLEDEKEFDEFNDSEEGIEKEVKEASEEDIDYAEDELIDVADNNDGNSNIKLDYQPGEDDEIIDDVISGKEA